MITAAIVSFAQPELLAACLASLPAETEIVVVDNAGDEASRAVCDRDPRVQFITGEGNRGFGAASNRAWRAGSGDPVLFVNSDAILDPGALESMEREFRDPGVAAVAPRLRFPDGRHQPSTGRDPWALGYLWSRMFPHHRRGFHGRGYDRARDVDWATAACLMVRRDALMQVGGFNEDFFLNLEDIDLCTRLRSGAGRVRYTPEAGGVHHVGGSMDSKNVAHLVAREKRRSHLIFFAKHRSRFEFGVVRGLNVTFAVAAAAGNRPPGREFWWGLARHLRRGSQAVWARGNRS